MNENTRRASSEVEGGAEVSNRFLWTDHESGERLQVLVKGSAPFLDQLESRGFERLPEEPQVSSRGDGAGGENESHRGTLPDRILPGSIVIASRFPTARSERVLQLAPRESGGDRGQARRRGA